MTFFLLGGCALLVSCGDSGNKGGSENFGTGSGKVYDRGGLPDDLKGVAVGSGGDGRTDTNVSTAGTPSNRPGLSKPATPPAEEKALLNQ